MHQPSKSGDQFSHQQGADHPANGKDGDGEGVQDCEDLLIRTPVVALYQRLVVEVLNVLVEEINNLRSIN